MRLEHKRARQAGFSLIELLTVVAIIVILSAIAYPNIAEYVRHYRLRGGTGDVVADLQRARATAVMKDVHFGVLFVVLDAKTYRFVIEDAQSGTDRTVRVSPSATPLADAQAGPVHVLPQGIEFATTGCGMSGTGGDTVRFNRLGMACKPTTGSTTCPAATAGGTTKALIFATSGDVQVCLQDTVRKLSRLITVSPGGRVFSQSSTS